MLGFLGDLHGYHGGFGDDKVTAWVQVGDLGFYPKFMREWRRKDAPVYFCRGNHEWHPDLDEHKYKTEPVEVADGLFYVPSGVVVTLDGWCIGFCGGAASIDYNLREAGKSWHPESEVTTSEEVDRAIRMECDIIVTHTFPQSVIDRVFGPPPQIFGQDPGWFDSSAVELERLYQAQKGRYTFWFGGHFHRAAWDKTSRIRVLAEYEKLLIASRSRNRKKNLTV